MPASAPPGGVTIPRTWVWYEQPGQVGIAVPGDWLFDAGSSIDCFYNPSPADGRLIGVYAWSINGTGPTALYNAVTNQARLFVPDAPPGFHDMGVKHVTCAVTCVSWSYSYTPPGRASMRADAETFLEPNHVAYTVTWTASSESWADQITNEKDVLQSFRPLS